MTAPLDYCRQHDHFAAANGIELLEMSPGRARARMTVTAQRLNSIGTAHGGALVTLAATTLFAACNEAGQTAVRRNMSITCLKSVSTGVLTAEAAEIARSRKLAHGSVRISDESGQLVAIFQGTAYIKHAPYPPQEKLESK
jgi:acyl-CoA thioesterase